MASYQVIPRKYRPQTFASVVGQDAIVTTLKNALRFQRFAHAYLFTGCRGTGKTTLARVLAKALNCQQRTEAQEPCNACPSCLEVISGRSLDVLEIDGASNRGIDDIRQINETVAYAPASGQFKIYIIDEVHMLTKEAFNALLKTLEEPPPNVKFFFATTEPHKVLPTIISRCQRFDLNRIPTDIIAAKLAWIAADLGADCEPDALSLIAHLSEGGLRDAESLLDQVICYAEKPITLDKVSATLGLMPRSTFFALDQAIATQNVAYAFELTQQIFSSGKDLGHFLDNLIEHFRTLLQIKLGKDPLVFNAEEKVLYTASAASNYTEEQCLAILDYLVHWQQQLQKTPLKRISLEMILLHLIRSKNRISLAALVKRLVDLEQGAPVAAQPEPALQPAKAPEPAPVVEARKAPEPQPIEQPAPKLSIEESLLKKVQSKIDEKTAEPIRAAPAPVTVEQPKINNPAPAAVVQTQTKTDSPPGRYETLIRFAAVELEGVVKKEA